MLRTKSRWRQLPQAEKVNALVEASAEGLTAAQFAERYGATVPQIEAYMSFCRREKCIDIKLTHAKRGAPPKQTRAAAMMILVRAGFSVRELAEVFELSPVTIHAFAQRHNIDLPVGSKCVS